MQLLVVWQAIEIYVNGFSEISPKQVLLNNQESIQVTLMIDNNFYMG